MAIFPFQLQVASSPQALAEWFVATLGVLIAVTLIYIFILQKSPPPEGPTIAKLEGMREEEKSIEYGAVIAKAQQELGAGNCSSAVQKSVEAVGVALSSVLASLGADSSRMSVSDMAYLIQTRAKTSPEITQPLYHLNSLRLRALQGGVITQQEGQWAVSTALWLFQILSAGQIAF